jgi:hypothetical protein
VKKLIESIVVLAAAAILLGSPATSLGQDKAKEKAAEKAKEKGKDGEKGKKEGVTPFNGKAAAVDKAAKTVKLTGEKGRVIQVTGTTRVVKDGKPASLDDLKEGEDVSGAYKAAADGKLEATVLNIGKPAPKKKADDKKKDEKK